MDGILIVNKPEKMTSHDVVNKLRKILKTKKIGHTGTLDPDATGVLIVLVGKACKLLPFLKDVDKTYQAELVLGKQTFTDDIFGEVLAEQAIKPIENFQSLLNEFKGVSKQQPPMVSSVKINGKKLYEYARNNEVIDRPWRTIEIFDIKVLDDKKLSFEVHCSSGTYVRSLCVDLAKKSGNIGCMGHLKRTKVGRFSINDAYTLEEIEDGNYQLLDSILLLDHLPQFEYEPIDDIYNGKKIKLASQAEQVLITHQNKPIAIYELMEHKKGYRSVRGLW